MVITEASGFELLRRSNLFNSIQIIEVEITSIDMAVNVSIDTVNVSSTFIKNYPRISNSGFSSTEFTAILLDENTVRLERGGTNNAGTVTLYVYELNNGRVQTLSFNPGNSSSTTLNIDSVDASRIFFIINFNSTSGNANLAFSHFVPTLIDSTTLLIRHTGASVTRNCIVQVIEF